MENNHIYQLLAQPRLYNYSSYLELLPGVDQKEANTLELFSFGDIEHYLKYTDQYLSLDNVLIRKLISLSILSIVSRNVGNEIPLKSILTELHYVPSIEDLEDLLIQMIDMECFHATIDQKKGTVYVQQMLVLRDAFNLETHALLRVLTEEDIEHRSVAWARRVLQSWMDAKISPAKEQLLLEPPAPEDKLVIE
ncbi:hypothetical protein PUMCH_002413 [Australozyma saopauloensis]|uniref:PCI domain-containing protein n=1 Tax=Australozyma saopauloensis TaxID=291208 RepID=A0AAX4HBF6_9ASCO|nr:hypothetical protein PUMCH_002413 [[Candida] saopauloensis]